VPLGLAPPQQTPTNPSLPAPPGTGRIVLATNPTFSAIINYTPPDYDVVEIDATLGTITRNIPAVGTMNFGIAVQPNTGDLWVANTEARNLIFFEPVLKGHAVDNRVTKIALGGPTPVVTPYDLNPGINYGAFPNTAALNTALAQPTDVVWNPAGTLLYVASLGTDRIGVVNPSGAVTTRIEIGTNPGSTTNPRTKKGPRGLVHHQTLNRLYVLNRLSQSVTTIDTAANTVLSERALAASTPEPQTTRDGRGFLYDAKLSGTGRSPAPPVTSTPTGTTSRGTSAIRVGTC
jgi:DNA-binding beta-propeller fold protein YncE